MFGSFGSGFNADDVLPVTTAPGPLSEVCRYKLNGD
jgi:hypothetical protein